MAILLMYNSSDQYTIQQITDTLNIKSDILLQVSALTHLHTLRVMILFTHCVI